MVFNYYSVLGLTRTATALEIKAAFKRLAIQFHPDKNPGNIHAEEKFKQINEAYQVLSNLQKRRMYDLKLDYIIQQQQIRQQQQTYATRQREPASVKERYYRPRAKRREFSRRDWQIVVGFFAALILGSLLVNVVMSRVTANKRFRNAQTFIEQRQWSSAHSMLSEAIYFEPKFSEAYRSRAYINMSVYQNYSAAISDYNAALSFGDTPTAETYFYRGKCYAGLQEYKQAEADYTTAITLDANFKPAYFERGQIRLLNLDDFTQAIKDLSTYLENPVSLNEKNAALLYRGFAYYLTDKYPEAIADYTTALKTDVRNGRLYYLLGKAEAVLGNHKLACNYFAQAYHLNYEAAMIDWQNECRQ